MTKDKHKEMKDTIFPFRYWKFYMIRKIFSLFHQLNTFYMHFLEHVGIFYVHQHDRRKIVFHYVLTENELRSNTLPNTIR